jgi:hypothetical protein
MDFSLLQNLNRVFIFSTKTSASVLACLGAMARVNLIVGRGTRVEPNEQKSFIQREYSERRSGGPNDEAPGTALPDNIWFGNASVPYGRFDSDHHQIPMGCFLAATLAGWASIRPAKATGR